MTHITCMSLSHRGGRKSAQAGNKDSFHCFPPATETAGHVRMEAMGRGSPEHTYLQAAETNVEFTGHMHVPVTSFILFLFLPNR